MTTIGKRLISAAKEAAAIAKGDKEPARIFVPSDIDVKEIRRNLHLTQDDFASEFGFTVNQIRDWEQLRTRPTGGARAYLLLVESEPTRIRGLLKSLRKAAKEAAIEADPLCAKAYAHLSNWHSYSILAHCAPANEAREITRSLAEKALQIEPNDPYILALLAEGYLMAGDLDPARKCIEKAIKLNSNYYIVMIYAADVLAWLGDIDEALRWRELCVLHDPLSTASMTEVDLEVFYLAERYDDAINAISGWHNTSIHLIAEFAATYAQAGQIDQAVAMREQFEARVPDGYTIENHVDGQLRMCALQKHRDLWLEGYRKAGFDV